MPESISTRAQRRAAASQRRPDGDNCLFRRQFAAGPLRCTAIQSGASRTYIYPARGQSPQQQEFADKGQCYSWAVQQTGFNLQSPGGDTAASCAGAAEGGLFRGGRRCGARSHRRCHRRQCGQRRGHRRRRRRGLFGPMRRARREEEQQQQQINMAEQQSAWPGATPLQPGLRDLHQGPRLHAEHLTLGLPLTARHHDAPRGLIRTPRTAPASPVLDMGRPRGGRLRRDLELGARRPSDAHRVDPGTLLVRFLLEAVEELDSPPLSEPLVKGVLPVWELRRS